MNKLLAFWNSKSQGAKSAIVFTLALLVSRGLSFITMPIFTRIMPADQIGIVGLYTSSFAILSSITSLGLTSGGFMVGMKDYGSRREQYISSILSLTTLCSIFFSVLFIVYPTLWTNLLGIPKGLIYLMLIGCLVTPAYEFWLMRQRYEYAYKKAALLTVLISLISTLLAVAAVLLSKDRTSNTGEVRIYVSVGSSLLVYLVLWLVQLKRGGVLYNKEYWTTSLALGLPLLGHAFASQILSVSDRILIGKFVNNTAVGIYTTLYSVGSLSLIFWSAINSSFVPYLFQNIESQKEKSSVSKISVQLLSMFAAITIGISLLAPEVVRLLAPSEYYEHVSIIPPIVAGVFFIAVGNLYSNILVYCKKTLAIMFSSIIACIFSIILNIVLIPKLGFEVAAYNTLLSYVIFACLQAICSYRLFKRQYEGEFVYDNVKIFIVIITTVLLCLICIPLYNYKILRYLIAGVVLLLLGFQYVKRINTKTV